MDRPGWELIVPGGWLIPTGPQRAAIERGGLTALQVTRVVRPAFALTGSVSWARSRDVASSGRPKLDVFGVDVGAEARGRRWFANRAVTLRPFAGIGAGMRSYNYRSLDVDAAHNLAGYVAGGAELGYRRFRLRLEARDYVSGFRPLVAQGDSDTRNDVALLLGLRFVQR